MTIRFLMRRLRRPDDGGDATGSQGVASTPSPTPIAAPAPEPAAAPSAPAAAPTPAVASPAPGPKTMLEAINDRFDPAKTDLATGQPRDPQGRFAPKDAAGAPIAPAAAAPAGNPTAAAAPKPAAAAPAPGAQPATVEPDDLVMPEGLQPKAQERFQKLANNVKAVTAERDTIAAERDEARQQVNYVREQFQTHGIKQPQFEQAAKVIGLMNSGRLEDALAVLDDQRRQISLALGRPLPGVDALAQFPDLRGAVDNLQITEQHAIELARGRAQQDAQQRQQQQAVQAQQTQQATQQAVQQGTVAVDNLCKQLAASDIDFPVIEARLLPVIKDILQGVPPNQWENTVRRQYDLLKGMAAQARQSNATQGAVLRPTGQGAAPAAPPKTMYEAMFGPKG